MKKVTVIFHSQWGHTAKMAQAVYEGAKSVNDTQVNLVDIDDVGNDFTQINASDALIFGTPTYFGTVSASMKSFMEKTSNIYAARGWQDKIAAGFTNSGGLSGDKLNTLMDLAVFAAQHGMHWVNLGLLTGISRSIDDDDGLNRLGSYLGAMAYSPTDKDGDSALSEGDRATAFHLGKRVARFAHSVSPLND